MRKITLVKKILISIMFCGFISVPLISNAQISSDLDKQSEIYSTNYKILAGYNEKADFGAVSARIISVALLLVGMIFVALVVYGGYLWLTASGNTEQVKKAQDTLKASIFGILIVLGGYVISYYIIQSAVIATQTRNPESYTNL